MAEKKLNIGNLVTPNGASMIFGTEASNDGLTLKTEHDETWNPYTLIIDEEIDENIPATMVDYTPSADNILTSTNVQDAIDELANSLDDVGGAFYAEYGTTSLSDVKEAYNAGKNIIARASVVDEGTSHTIDFPLVAASENLFMFSAIMGTMAQVFILSASGWEDVGTTDFVTTDTYATQDTYGITLLSGATNSTANNVAATSSAVKAAYDLAASKTSNTGTITEVKANGTSIATSGVANIPAASTSAYGVTKLNTATNSTSETEAATASAVKAAYDLAASKTSNTGTITKVQANGTDVASSGTANIPAATTSAYGVTKLSSSTSSTSTSLAATPSAVKSAYDLANAAMPKTGGAFTGAISYSGTTTISSSTAYYRPIRVSTSAPSSSDGNVGDIWIQYS